MYYVQQGNMFRDRFISLLASRQGTFTKRGAIGIATNALFFMFSCQKIILILHISFICFYCLKIFINDS
jgi:hypothetical protein